LLPIENFVSLGIANSGLATDDLVLFLGALLLVLSKLEDLGAGRKEFFCSGSVEHHLKPVRESVILVDLEVDEDF
jgi:hypothetical protein